MKILILLLLGMMPQTQTKPLLVQMPESQMTIQLIEGNAPNIKTAAMWPNDAVRYPVTCEFKSDHEVTCMIQPAPEPMDVPATTFPVKSIMIPISLCGESVICTGDMVGCSHHGTMDEHGLCQNGFEYTCSEKSRILLTAEDGTRHCVKF